jgi:hypothetical protein
MKPTLDILNRCDSIRVFPKTDFNYHATTLADLDGLCAGCRRPSSFCAISQDYFANEAPQHFAREAMLFFMMMMTVAWPLLNAAIAVQELIRI